MNYTSVKIILFILLMSTNCFSQESQVENDSLREEKAIELNLDIFSRYLWRGQCWGGNYVVVQPAINYSITPKINLGFWATTNFQNDYYYSDGTVGKGYQEIDFSIAYQVNDFLQFQLWDYYWPSVEKVDGVDNNYFNYGTNSVKTVDAILYFDFSEGYKYPFNATISTLVAGNDYRYDSNGENPKQNYTTYLELGYTFTFFEKSSIKALQDIEISPVIGAVLNNKAAYYTYADYDKVSFVNMGIKVTKEIALAWGITMPLTLNYTHNGAKQNTEFFGKDFLVAGVSFNY
ncbi:hypothetical protein ACSVH2_09380 [Flavobacterium sp. RSB2_4_14]|uniref:hypothetical protein n=1 Tax=Flavobacterium sp. RSB2_4_14 TaxID=3447665 RepID=UPI003F40F93E